METSRITLLGFKLPVLNCILHTKLFILAYFYLSQLIYFILVVL